MPRISIENVNKNLQNRSLLEYSNKHLKKWGLSQSEQSDLYQILWSMLDIEHSIQDHNLL